VNTIPGIEEVNIIKDDNSIIHFVNPKGKPLGQCWSDPASRCMYLAGAGPHLGLLLPLTAFPASSAVVFCAAVQASIAANTYVVSGPSTTKSIAGVQRKQQRL
jgi:hypothetical protein